MDSRSFRGILWTGGGDRRPLSEEDDIVAPKRRPVGRRKGREEMRLPRGTGEVEPATSDGFERSRIQSGWEKGEGSLEYRVG